MLRIDFLFVWIYYFELLANRFFSDHHNCNPNAHFNPTVISFRGSHLFLTITDGISNPLDVKKAL